MLNTTHSPALKARWKEARGVSRRIIVEGCLVAQEPLHLGGAEADDLGADLPLLMTDNGRPLLTGASLAGALRSHLRTREKGFRKAATDHEQDSLTVALFGGRSGDDEGPMSALIVCDAIGTMPDADDAYIEPREGVALDPTSRTAVQGALFDLEVWPAGTRFPLRFELALCDPKRAEDTKSPVTLSDPDRLRAALAAALQPLQQGTFTLGARKRRGYGQVKVDAWHIRSYDLTSTEGLLDWLTHGNEDVLDEAPNEAKAFAEGPKRDLWAALEADKSVLPDDLRTFAHLKATFALDGSLLIRSGLAPESGSPDATHLTSYRPEHGKTMPVLSGTTLGGALRARTRKILRTLLPYDDPDANRDRAADIVARLFGYGPEIQSQLPELPEGPHASRLATREHAITGAETDLVQNRVSIDRFTGGALDTALFNERPAFGGDDSEVTVEVRIVNPERHEVGLLLLLLKDLWTGDLPLGGEQSVGRGRLKGIRADLTCRLSEEQEAEATSETEEPVERSWTITQESKALAFAREHEADKTVQRELQDFVDALHNHLDRKL